MATLELMAEKPPMMLDQDGVIRVGGTRVSIDTVLAAFQNGCTPEAIQSKYPSLHLTHVYGAITYYLNHTCEIDDYLAIRRVAIEAAEREIEERFPSEGVRERLLARRLAKL